MLIAAATVLVVGGGGGAALVAANDKDHPSRDLFSNSPAAGEPNSPTPSEAAPTPDPATPPDTTTTTPTTEGQPTTTQPAPPSSQPGASAKRKTHFKREKGKSNNDRRTREFAVPPAREFSGEGNAHLGTVDVKATSILKWKTKGHFEIRFGREDFPVIAPTKSGQLVLPPFRFERVRVIAPGRWKITISPQ